MARLLSLFGASVALLAILAGCGPTSPWELTPIPQATPPSVVHVPPAPNTSPSATSPASGASGAKPASH